MLAFALLTVLLIIKMRGAEKVLWKHIYSVSGSMIVLCILQFLNKDGNSQKFLAGTISLLWLEIFIIQILVIVLCHICQRSTEPKSAEPKIRKTTQEWPPARKES